MLRRLVAFFVLGAFLHAQTEKKALKTDPPKGTYEAIFFKAAQLVSNLNTFESEDSIEDQTEETHHLVESREISSPSFYLNRFGFA